MAPQRLEKIESGPGNGMGSEASNPQDVVDGADRENDKRAALQKKAPKALISLDAELKSAPGEMGHLGRRRPGVGGEPNHVDGRDEPHIR